MSSLPEPSAEDLERSGRLLALMRERIRAAGGWIGFDAYMQAALYTPGLGYYDAPGRKFGNHGDYVTAPGLSPLFAGAIARQLAQAFESLPLRVLEFGAGTGDLAADLLNALARLGLGAVEYQILEVSADLRARQQERLAAHPGVRWLDRLPDDFEGVVVANEVMDVIPVHLLAYGRPDGGPGPAGAGDTATAAWLERGVGLDAQGALCWRDRPLPPHLQPEADAIERAVGGPPAEGYCTEAAPQVGAWLQALALMVERGLVLAFDYGFPAREYYHPQRAMGTLMCHYRHHAHADPLWLPGLNDITAHVDFSACARAAHEAGLSVLGYTSQAHFLVNCGILDLLSQDSAQTGAVHRLLSEAEMGELLKVIALGRRVDLDLIGFRRGDRSHRL